MIRITLNGEVQAQRKLDQSLPLDKTRLELSHQMPNETIRFLNNGQPVQIQEEESMTVKDIIGDSKEIGLIEYTPHEVNDDDNDTPTQVQDLQESVGNQVKISIDNQRILFISIEDFQPLSEVRKAMASQIEGNFQFQLNGLDIDHKDEELTSIKELLNERQQIDIRSYICQAKDIIFQNPKASNNGSPSQILLKKEELKPNISGKSIQNEKYKEKLSLTKQNDLSIMFKEACLMPNCAEKSILQLLYYTGCKLLGLILDQESDQIQLENLDKVLATEFEGLKDKLIDEQNFDNITQKYYQECSNCIKQQQWKNTQLKLEAMLKKYQIFDIKLLKTLIEKVDDAAKIIIDKNIILTLGATGSGKSTTIHFLAGSKMGHTEVEGLDHIDALEIVNYMTKNVICSPFAKSETRYITPVEVEFKSVGSLNKGSIFIVDSPGFGDTNGPEVDTANSVGIIKAIHGCKSVRLAILISNNNIGDRMTGVKDLSEILVSMIDGIKSHLRSFTYIFTKFPENKKHKINAMLIDLVLQMSDEQKEDENFLGILKNLVLQTKKGALTLDPINDNPAELLDYFSEVQPIKNPSEVFKMFISKNSQAKINLQIQMHHQIIQRAIKRRDYNLIQYKLNDLNYLYKELQQQSIEQTYQDCVNELISHLISNFELAKKDLKKSLSLNNTLSSDDVKKFQQQKDEQMQAEELIQTHLNGNAPYAEAFTLYLQEQLREVVSEIKQKDVVDLSNAQMLEKIQLIALTINEFEFLYKESLYEIVRKQQVIIDTFRKSLDCSQFEEASKALSQYQLTFKLYKNYLEEQSQKDKLDFAQNCLIEYLTQLTESSKNILDKNLLSITEIEQIKNISLQLGKVASAFSNQKKEMQLKIDMIKKEFVENIKKLFNNTLEKIGKNDQYDDKNSSQNSEAYFDQLKCLHELEVIKSETSQSYYEKIENFKGYIMEQQRVIESLINQIGQKNDPKNYVKLFQSLSSLENLKWFEKYSNGIFFGVMDEIKYQLSYYLENVTEEIRQIRISLEHPDKIKEADMKVRELNAMIKLKKYIPEIESTIMSTTEEFRKIIKVIFDNIISNCDSKKLNDQNHSQELMNIKKVTKSLKFINQCQDLKYVTKEECEIILSLISKYIEDYGLQVQEKWKKINYELKFLKDYDDQMIINQLSAQLINLYGECQNMSQNYLEVYEIYSCQDQQENWKKQLISFLGDLRDDMDQQNNLGNLNVLRGKLLVAKSLRPMDCYLIGDASFQDLYSQYNQKYFTNASDQSLQIINYIDNKSFSETLNIFLIFQQSKDDTSQQKIQKSQSHLNKSIQIIIDETTRLCSKILIRENFNEQKIQDIIKQLKYLADAQIYLKDYLHPKDIIESNIGRIQQTLNQSLLNHIQYVFDLLSNDEIIRAKKEMQNLEVLCDLIGLHQSKDSVNQREKLQTEINQSSNNIIKRFQEMDPDQYTVNPPKETYSRLQKKVNSDYNATLLEIDKIISNKLHQKLDDISKMSFYNERQNKIKMFNFILMTLPDHIKDIIQQQVILKMDEIKRTTEEAKIELDSILNNELFNKIDETYDRVQSEKNVQIINEIEMKIRQNVFDLKDFIEQNIQDLEQPVFDKLDKINDYYNFITKKMPQESLQVFYDIHQIIQKQICINLTILNNLFNSNTIMKTQEYQQNSNKFFRSTTDEEYQNRLQQNHQQSLEWIIKFIKFLLQDKSKSHDKNNEYKQIIIILFIEVNNHMTNNYDKYQSVVREELRDIESLKIVLKQMKQWDPLLTQLKQESDLFVKLSPHKLECFKKNLKEFQSYNSCISFVSSKFKSIKVSFLSSCDNLINEKTSHLQKDRQNFYKDLNDQLKMFQQTQELNDLNTFDFNSQSAWKDCTQRLMWNIDIIIKEIEEIIKNLDLNQSNCQKLNIDYNQIDSFVKCIEFTGIKILQQKQQIDDLLFNRVNKIQSSIEEEKNVSIVAELLIQIQEVAMNVSFFKEFCEKKIDESIIKYKIIVGPQNINKLGIVLEQNPIGKLIVQDNKQLAGFAKALTNQKLQKHGIDYVLENIKGDDIDRTKLKNRYKTYIDKFDELLQKYLVPGQDLKVICNNLKIQIGKTVFENDRKGEMTYALNADIIDIIPELVAQVSVLYTMLNAQFYFEFSESNNQDDYLFKVHAAQIISIFRIFGCGDPSQKLMNNLVQIGTGEGKSITLALTSALLALLGYEVSCACYSLYLSQRDYNQFKKLFELLDIVQYIHYGTFDKVCENFINQNGDVRTIIENVITGKNQGALPIQKQSTRPKILLIDEVDVFFSKDFYGNTYQPILSLKDPTINELINFIWVQRNSNLTQQKVLNSTQYKQVITKFNQWQKIINKSVNDMIEDVSIYQNHQYIVQNDKIGYKQQDAVAFNIKDRYKTMFAYFFENQNGKISQKSLEDSQCIQVDCGIFSFAEIPSQFVHIMGVTGTLKTLSESELQVVKEEYNIKKFTYSPSVFGKNDRQFFPTHDCKVETSDDYYIQLVEEIKNRMTGVNPQTKRAVLVFFEDKQELMDFHNSPQYEQMLSNDTLQTLILTEEATQSEKENIVRQATTQGKISFYTKCFGRGTDFIARDNIVTSNGGLHVIQTFFPEEISLEAQIMGRTARQGDKGSFSMILLDKSLEKYLTIEEIKNNKDNIYNVLNIKRNILFNEQLLNNKKSIENAKKVHQESEKLLQSIQKNDINDVKQFLLTRNQ